MYFLVPWYHGFLSLGRKILSLFIYFSPFILIFIYYKDNIVRSKWPQVGQYILQITLQAYFLMQIMHACMNNPTPPPALNKQPPLVE